MGVYIILSAIVSVTLHSANPPIVRATLAESYVYTAGVNKQSNGLHAALGGGQFSLLRQDMKQQPKFTAFDHLKAIHGGWNALLRWQLIDNKLYCSPYGIATYVAVYRSTAGINAVPMSALENLYVSRDKPDYEKRQAEFRDVNENWPILGMTLASCVWQTDAIKEQIYFDFWAKSGKRYEVYVTEPHEGNRLTREDSTPDKMGKGGQYEKLNWTTTNTWTFDWTGPFYVTATGDERFFVTDAGRVYTPPKDAKPGALLKELWKGAPVDVLIHDSDHKTWYAFTKDQYFEVADPIKPKPHTLTIRRSWFAEPALETAAKCGRVIRGLPEPK